VDVLGRNHALEAALAELVDNSLDAGATQIVIRFVQRYEKLEQVVVVDDGCGMSDREIDVAMTIGGEREYGADEIGRFGFGLKSASFGQADILTVFSRDESGHATGRRWRLQNARKDFACDVVDAAFASSVLSSEWELNPGSSGTVIRWDDVRGFPVSASATETQRFLQDAFARISTYFGLIYHRILEDSAAQILLSVYDVEEGPGQSVLVAPLDPFAYPRSGAPGWPKTLAISVDGASLQVQCHVWPGRSSLDEFRLDGNLLGRQGLFVYYRGRLIQAGGWNGLVVSDKQLNLARMALEITSDVPEVLAIRPEKNGIESGPRFAALFHSAEAIDGSTFSDYLDVARDRFKDSNRRDRGRRARLEPGPGFSPRVKRAIEAELPLRDDEPLAIRWAPLGNEEFFEVDRDDSTLWLNKRYRAALSGGRAGRLNDLPVMKVLLFLLFEEIFAGTNIGPRDRDNLELWQSLLIAAARAEDEER
jgi:hypothetical protein